MVQTQQHPSLWRLRYDVLSTRVLLFIANADQVGTPRPEVHVFLADRYERLANHYERKGARGRAQRLAAKARWHWSQGGFDDFPRAAAMAMPVPRPPIFTDARGRYWGRQGPPDDDAA
jgi:hypothetical protein